MPVEVEAVNEERITLCDRCGAMIPWGSSPCPECHRNPDGAGPLMGTIEDWRRTLSEQIDQHARKGVKYFKWLPAHDDRVCPQCKSRADVPFTLAEVRAQLEGEFCTPADKDQGCRCVFVPYGGA